MNDKRTKFQETHENMEKNIPNCIFNHLFDAAHALFGLSAFISVLQLKLFIFVIASCIIIVSNQACSEYLPNAVHSHLWIHICEIDNMWEFAREICVY